MADNVETKDGVETEASREITDEKLEQVAGGSREDHVCPDCGSRNYFWRGEARAFVCGDCLYIG